MLQASDILKALANSGFKAKILNGVFFDTVDPANRIDHWIYQKSDRRIELYEPGDSSWNSQTVLLRLLELHPGLAKAAQVSKVQVLVSYESSEEADDFFKVSTFASLHDLKDRRGIRSLHYFDTGEKLANLSLFEYRLESYGDEAGVSLSRVHVERLEDTPFQKLMRYHNPSRAKSTALVKAHFFARRLIDFVQTELKTQYFSRPDQARRVKRLVLYFAIDDELNFCLVSIPTCELGAAKTLPEFCTVAQSKLSSTEPKFCLSRKAPALDTYASAKGPSLSRFIVAAKRRNHLGLKEVANSTTVAKGMLDSSIKRMSKEDWRHSRTIHADSKFSLQISRSKSVGRPTRGNWTKVGESVLGPRSSVGAGAKSRGKSQALANAVVKVQSLVAPAVSQKYLTAAKCKFASTYELKSKFSLGGKSMLLKQQ